MGGNFSKPWPSKELLMERKREEFRRFVEEEEVRRKREEEELQRENCVYRKEIQSEIKISQIPSEQRNIQPR
jgi:hypothetical protein